MKDETIIVPKNPLYLPPWGDVNLIVLTDVHSWIAGHGRHEPKMNVDYGDVMSFVQHLRKHCKGDLFVVMNGDFMDGTGLSTRPPKYLTPLLEQMPFDIINLGNHELYDNKTVDWITNEFAPRWNGHYLTSNSFVVTDDGNDKTTIGDRYCILQGSNGKRILVFGFLFNFKGHSKNSFVQDVQDTVKLGWFQNILKERGSYDSIIVMAHMHVTDPLVDTILSAIRTHQDTMQVVFVTGHTHIRDYQVLDDNAVSFEAGRYLDTIGFISWNFSSVVVAQPQQQQDHTRDDVASLSTPMERFPFAFLDTDRNLLAGIVDTLTPHPSSSTTATNSTNNDVTDEGLPFVMMTSEGNLLREKIHATQDSLGLLKNIGCSPRDFVLNTSLDNDNGDYDTLIDQSTPISSLLGLYINQIVPQLLLNDIHNNNNNNNNNKKKNNRHSYDVFVQGTNALRYDLFEGTVLLDDVISVCPFNDTIYRLPINLKGWQLLEIINIPAHSPYLPLQSYPNIDGPRNSKLPDLPQWVVATATPPGHALHWQETYQVLTPEFHVPYFMERIVNITSTKGKTDDQRAPPPTITTTVERIPILKKNNYHYTTTDFWVDYITVNWPSCSFLSTATSTVAAATATTATTLQKDTATDISDLLLLLLCIFICGIIVCWCCGGIRRRNDTYTYI